jgi:YD repeat-containing protein
MIEASTPYPRRCRGGRYPAGYDRPGYDRPACGENGTCIPGSTRRGQWLTQQLTGNAITSYSCNDRNLLTGITDPSGTLWYFAYDADGRRILTLFGTDSTQSTYLGKINTSYDKSGRITAGQMILATSGSSTETFSYADRTRAELLSDGSTGGITYGLTGQDGQPWVQDYTASTSGEQVNVTHDQQGDILGEDNSNGGDIMYVTDNLGSVVATIGSSGHGVLTDPYTPYGLDAQPGSLGPMFTFTGALQDTVSPGTGFVHLGYRWYDPASEPDAGVGNQAGPAASPSPTAPRSSPTPPTATGTPMPPTAPPTTSTPPGQAGGTRSAGAARLVVMR